MPTVPKTRERRATIRPLRDGGFVLTRGQEVYVASQDDLVEAIVLAGVIDLVFEYVKRRRLLIA
jgi:hypothetical protein